MWASPRRSTHSAAVANATRWPAWQARIEIPIARWVLPVPGGPEEHDVGAFGSMKSSVPRCAIASRLRERWKLEVEVLECLAGREPRGADAALAAVVLAGRDLAFETRGEELLVGPALGSGPFGEPFDRVGRATVLSAPGTDTRCRWSAWSRGHHATPSARS